ncbi:MAG: hypothetical protein ABIW80_11215 [Lapillicoccus sp.]
MATQGLFDQVKDFLLGHPDLPGAMETVPAPGPDVAPEALPEPLPEARPEPPSATD